MAAPEPTDDACLQREVIRFLASPAAHGGETPEHKETHLSHVFLTRERVLKLKKAQDWSVVDYSTLAQRERFCREELTINARFAPEIYRDVRAITREGAGFALDGPGEVVDYVVEMARFDDAGELDILVDDGTITGELIDMTADVVADMHRTAPIVRRPHQSRIVAGLTRQLSRDVAAAVTEAEEKADVALWTHKASERLMRDAARVDRRGRHGFVRRCHGDLHLSNICLWKGRPTPFDAIEFSEEIAVIDVLYDLAFVLVDLEHRGRGDLATRLLSRYLAATRDYSGLAALPLYKSQRHMVRALTGATKGRPVADHIAAARAIAERAVAPHLYAIGGLSGSGKTTIARAVAPELGAVVIRADTVRKHIWGVAPEVHLGAAAYDAVTTERVYRRLRVDAARALRAGSSVVLDATFADPADRAAVRRLANHLGVPFAGIWLKAPRAILAERVAGRSGDASDADVAVVEAQSHRDLGAIDWIDVAANAEPDEVAMAALGYLAPVARTAQRPPPRRGAPR